MKTSLRKLIKPLFAIPVIIVVFASCTATVKVPKHPGPGEPPTPPKVEVHQN